MKTLLVFFLLVLALQLAAEMEFTQQGTIPVSNGTFAYAELKNYHGDERILVYSQTTTSIYVKVCDPEGNLIESFTLTTTDNTDERKMSYFEYDDTGYMVVNYTIRGQRSYNGDNWTRSERAYSDIYNLETGSLVDHQNVASKTSSYSQYEDPYEPWYNYDSTITWTLNPQQPVTQYFGSGYCKLNVPFRFRRHSYYTAYDQINEEDEVLYPLYEEVFDVTSVNYQYFEDTGMYILSGQDEQLPKISAGYNRTFYDYNDAWPIRQWVVWGFIYDDSLIMSELLAAEADFSFFGVYETSRYVLLSDYYPESSQSFTLLTITDYEDFEFGERDLSGNIIWSSSETTLDMYDDLIAKQYHSCCFINCEGNPCTLYYRDEGSSWEARNRLDGSIVDHGTFSFPTPVNLGRLLDGTIVLLSEGDSDVVVYHANTGIIEIELNIEAGSGFVNLDWNDIEGATGYKVYSADTPDGVFTFLADASMSQHYITTLPDTQKYYKVTAVFGE